ncbi:DNAJC27 (predicted) [Pycnogonum litorale]
MMLKTKIITVGNRDVGKSCIIKRLCEKRFISKYSPTVGIDYGATKVKFEGREIRVDIFDMSGHPLFYEVRNEFYTDTQGVILVYDVSNRASFEALNFWLAEMNYELRNYAGEMENTVFIICANKVDLKNRAVSEAEGRRWADHHCFSYFNTSAYSNEGIADMFQTLLRSMIELREGSKQSIALCRNLGYTREQLEAIYRLKYCKNEYEKLGLHPGASRDAINKSYRRLAFLLHPDKSFAPGSEDAFKILVSTKSILLKYSKS